MTELIRDTAFGHLVRFVSRGKLLQYAEERDPSLYTRFIDEKQNGILQCYTDGLSESLSWKHNVLESTTYHLPTNPEVQYAAITTANILKKYFLKNREDLVAQLESVVAGDKKSLSRLHVLCTISRSQGGTDLFLTFTILLPSQGFTSEVKELITWKLPDHPAGACRGGPA